MTQPKTLALAVALEFDWNDVNPSERMLDAAAELRKLHAALDDAREMVIFWGAYASEYMQKKHKLQEDIDQLG